MTQPTPPVIDTDELPPTQYLILEVLAARHRLGEHLWTFPSLLRPQMNALANHGLIGWKGGITEGTIRAWLTDTGRAAALSPTYEPPAGGQPNPPYVQADLDRAADAIARQWGYTDLADADNARGREGDTVREAALAVLNALADAGRLADQQPTPPHVTEWLKQAVANHQPGQPDDIDRLYARATRLAAPTTKEPQP